jgi:hypothetical protein
MSIDIYGTKGVMLSWYHPGFVKCLAALDLIRSKKQDHRQAFEVAHFAGVVFFT